MQTGLVFNIQKYSVHDGPGIRTTVFLKGCPLCCAWCHNPESRSASPEFIRNENRCLGCGECRAACPFAAALPGPGPLPTRIEDCTLCGRCVEACPTGARQLVGERRSVPEVLAEIEQDRAFYEESGGGATFSGGEPLSQPEFLKELLGACRARGIHTAVDTSGFACTEALLEVARLADLILFDVKLMDEVRHRQFTGVSNVPILENLRALDRLPAHLWLRVPLIPGVNDDAANLDALGRLAALLSSVRQVNVLPYHKLGTEKLRRLAEPAPSMDWETPPEAQLRAVIDKLRSFGLNVKAGG